MVTYLPGTRTLEPGMGLGLLAPKMSLPNFYPPHVDVEPACSMSLPLLPVWMDVLSLILLSDFHSARFLMALSDGCYYILVVILMWLCEEASCV